MTTALSLSKDLSAPEHSGVEFGRSADGLYVARVGDLVFAMVPARDGQHLVASAWRVSRPLSDLRRDDFYSHHGAIDNEAAFRERMIEQAEHSRDLLALKRQTVRMNCNTPWGLSQGATIYADGIVCHTTAGHGGFKLSAARNAAVHPMLRVDDGFYEEDAAWAIVALTFPDLFTRYERKVGDQILRDWWPDGWQEIHGRALAPGESHEKDRRDFQRRHAQNWIVIAALLSDHHPDMSEVIATIGGARDHRAEERRFLVPSDDYTVGRFGFVIDETNHAAYDGPSGFASWRGRAG
ncbi:DUF7007 domain-containing protein [Rhizobium giardinii]|uniref:DUF7007 domain-containing protein n=1 Tax=Rhizobium giardinii TaxID=56731 RepID=A0A7W8XBH4_9HYPH|nr:hypothetical protein [Rhizobium giardinii]MBB5538802.1 hypothetical protein [Rhizobium giardinii]